MPHIPTDVRKLLESLGAKEGDVEKIYQDLAVLINVRAVEASAKRAKPETVAHIRTLSPEELRQYLQENPGALPTLTAEEYGAIATQVFREYTQSVKQ